MKYSVIFLFILISNKVFSQTDTLTNVRYSLGGSISLINDRSSYERPDLTYAVNSIFQYRFWRNWKIETGITYLNFQENDVYNASCDTLRGWESSHNESYKILQAPLSIKNEFIKKPHFSLMLGYGVEFNYILNLDSSNHISCNNNLKEPVYYKSVKNDKSFTISPFNLYIQPSYVINEKLKLSFCFGFKLIDLNKFEIINREKWTYNYLYHDYSIGLIWDL